MYRGSGEGERGLCSVVCGARATRTESGPRQPPTRGPKKGGTPGAGFSLGTTAKLN